jgi:hypothetical protein
MKAGLAQTGGAGEGGRHRGYGSDEGSCDRGYKLLAFVQ